MSIKLFELFVRKDDQSLLVSRHQDLVNRLIDAFKNFLAAPEIVAGLKVTTSIHNGGELLEFSLSTNAQMDLFRIDTEDASQVEQEAEELVDTLRIKLKALKDLAGESHLTSSLFWEILGKHGFKPNELELITVASTLNLKRIQLRTAKNEHYRIDLDHLLKTATKPTP
jgi:hypothetical protein